MPTYEFHLYKKDGSTTLVYKTLCLDDERARLKLLTIDDQRYDHFEIWRDMEKIAEGPRLIVN